MIQSKKINKTHHTYIKSITFEYKKKFHLIMAEQSYNDLLKHNQKLESELEQYKTLMNNLPISVFAKDVQNDYRYIIWNKEIERVLGLRASDVIGKTDYDIFTNKDEADYFRDYDTRVMVGGEIIDIPEEEITAQDGKIKSHTRRIPLYDSLNTPKVLLGCLENITDRVEAREALRQSEAQLIETNLSKDKFISLIAHDLKSPFNVLIGFSDLLLDNITDFTTEETVTYLKLIQKTANQTYFLLEDILLWSQSTQNKLPYNPTTISTKRCLLEVINLLHSSSESKEIKIEVLTTEDLTLVADEYMIKTILRNLLSNAIKFTRRGGKVDVSWKTDGVNGVISITDKGVGLTEEQQKRIWSLEKQHRSNGTEDEKGSGFGLLLCKEFIEKHNGTISVLSEVGQGSTFSVSIPPQL